MKLSIKKIVSTLALTSGFVVLIFLLEQVGHNRLIEVWQHLHFQLILILLYQCLPLLTLTLGWWLTFSKRSLTLFSSLLLLKTGGEAVNMMTPAGVAGGDSARLVLMAKILPGATPRASVVIDRMMFSLAAIVFLLVSVGVFIPILPMAFSLKVGLVVINVVILALLILFIVWQSHGFFEDAVKLGQRVPFLKAPLGKISEQLKPIDEHIMTFYRHHRFTLLMIFGLQVLVRILSVGEVYLISWFMHFGLSFLDCWMLIAMTIAINTIFVFIPGAVGILEGGYGYVAHLLGLAPEDGVVIQLIRRIRGLFWMGVGLLVISWLRRSPRLPKRGAV